MTSILLTMPFLNISTFIHAEKKLNILQVMIPNWKIQCL